MIVYSAIFLCKEIILNNNLSYVVRDNYPVTNFHSLIIPYRHADSFYDYAG